MSGKSEKATNDCLEDGEGLGSERAPIAIELTEKWRTAGYTPESVFAALESLPRRIWLDSATADSPAAETDRPELDRFSFLSADPIWQIDVHSSGPSPWREIRRVSELLPPNFDPSLPPFQGGLAGVVGYEAGRWLEELALGSCHSHQTDDLPTQAVSLGVYDWVLAYDHVLERCWLICQGLEGRMFEPAATGLLPDGSQRMKRRHELARRRADQIMTLLGPPSSGGRVESKLGGRSPKSSPHRDSVPGQDAIDDREIRRGPIGHGDSFRSIAHRTPLEGVWSNFTGRQYRQAIRQIVERICAGDSFQVNLSQRLTAEIGLTSPGAFYSELRKVNAAPFAGFYDGGDYQVLSSSPEGFLQLRGRHVVTRPIKGTVPRTGDVERDEVLAEELLASDKDRAENLMIVDLMRNDLSRVCSDASVVVTQTCQIERFRYVQHLVSVVEGDLSDGRDAVDLLMACFPGGSVTGAPKIEAMRTIAELEPHPRGPYCGSMGYISCGGGADFNILIRTITVTRGLVQIPVGGGITARSVPEIEESETWAKALGMLKALPTLGGLPDEMGGLLDGPEAQGTRHAEVCQSMATKLVK